MQKYERSAKDLMHDFAKAELKHGQIFTKADAVRWFGIHYPKLKSNTVGLHVDGMAVNSQNRKHHPHIRAGLGWDLFYKLPTGQFRLWDKDTDPTPIYRDDIISGQTVTTQTNTAEPEEPDDEIPASDSGNTFAYEKHLQDYLVRNLSSLEAGLQLYEDEGFTGVEYPVGGRFIDILCLDTNGSFVIIELKVSRGHDRVIGQILRYMGWIQKHLAEKKQVRGIIVASEITEDLRLAASQVPEIKLMEYEISFRLKPATGSLAG